MKAAFCFITHLFRAGLSAILMLQLSVPPASAQMTSIVPASPIGMTEAYQPTVIKGLTVDPVDPFTFEFIVAAADAAVDNSKKPSGAEEFSQAEILELIKYFLASLTIPEEHMWVNLSPYEPDRIIPSDFGQTQMGQDLLALDYLLKQLSSSLMNPNDEVGKKFWDKIYQRAMDEYGTTNIPMDTFNKIWIIPDRASVSVKGQTVMISGAHLKVMLEEDYVALQKTLGVEHFGLEGRTDENKFAVSGVTSDVVRNILIPAVEQEVNEGRTFAKLRQIYHSMILASWYKKNLKDSFLNRMVADSGMTAGVEAMDPQQHEAIYQKYVEAFRNGAFDLIREDYDPQSQQLIPRKYFSGGLDMGSLDVSTKDDASLVNENFLSVKANIANRAMLEEGKKDYKPAELPDAEFPERAPRDVQRGIDPIPWVAGAVLVVVAQFIPGMPSNLLAYALEFFSPPFVAFLYKHKQQIAVLASVLVLVAAFFYLRSTKVSQVKDYKIATYEDMHHLLLQELSDTSFVYYAAQHGAAQTGFEHEPVSRQHFEYHHKLLTALHADGFELGSGDKVLLIGPENVIDGRLSFEEVANVVKTFPHVGEIHIATTGRLQPFNGQNPAQYEAALQQLNRYIESMGSSAKVIFHDANVLFLPFESGEFKLVSMNEVVVSNTFPGTLTSDAYSEVARVLDSQGRLVASHAEQASPKGFGFQPIMSSDYNRTMTAYSFNPSDVKPVVLSRDFSQKTVRLIMDYLMERLGSSRDIHNKLMEISSSVYSQDWSDQELLEYIRLMRANEANQLYDQFTSAVSNAMLGTDHQVLGEQRNGGINLNSKMLNLDAGGETRQMVVPVGDPTMLKERISKFDPVIKSIQPFRGLSAVAQGN